MQFYIILQHHYHYTTNNDIYIFLMFPKFFVKDEKIIKGFGSQCFLMPKSMNDPLKNYFE